MFSAGLYKLNSVGAIALKAPGFNPCTCQVHSWFQSLLSNGSTLYRYISGPRGFEGIRHRVVSEVESGTPVAGLCKPNPVDPQP
jgi:hypothetical protein